MFSLNEADKKDIQELSELEKEIFPEDPWSYTQILNEFENGFSRIWILKVNKRTAGYLIFRKFNPEIEILRIGVKKEYRRKGIGTELMKRLFNFAIKEKISKIFLEVKMSNTPAYSFYKKMGFKELYRRKNYYKDEPALVMLKEI